MEHRIQRSDRSRRRSSLALALGLLTLLPSALDAQRMPEPAVSFDATQVESAYGAAAHESMRLPALGRAPEDDTRPIGYSIGGAVLGGVAGWFGGAFLGYQIDRLYPCTGMVCGYGMSGLIAGAAIGPALLVPIGTHLGSNRLEALRYSLPATLLIGLASYGLIGSTGATSVLFAPLVEIPVAFAIDYGVERE